MPKYMNNLCHRLHSNSLYAWISRRWHNSAIEICKCKHHNLSEVEWTKTNFYLPYANFFLLYAILSVKMIGARWLWILFKTFLSFTRQNLMKIIRKKTTFHILLSDQLCVGRENRWHLFIEFWVKIVQNWSSSFCVCLFTLLFHSPKGIKLDKKQTSSLMLELINFCLETVPIDFMCNENVYIV